MFKPSTKILIVDDMTAMRMLMIKMCKDLGFTDVIEAANGVRAWQAVQDAAAPAVGLIISDWEMPDGSGIDLVKRIRGDSRFHGIPFLIVTEQADQNHVMEALRAGVDNYMVKPVAVQTLKEKLEAIHKKYGGTPT